MVSLYVCPLTFDNKKNEILYSPLKIEWKKQVATVALKKGLTVDVFMNEKILPKLGDETTATVVAKFSYLPINGKSKNIFLVANENTNVNIVSMTDLYYESHIPSSENVEILDKKKVTKTNKYLRVRGQVLAFCIDVASYYLEEISLDDYIEFVQMESAEPRDVNDDEEVDGDSDDVDSEDDSDDVSDEDEDDELEDPDALDDELEDPDALDDELEDPDVLDDEIIDDDAEEDVKEAVEEDEDADADDDVEEDGAEEEEEEEAEEQEPGEDEDTGAGVGADVDIGDNEIEEAPKPSSKRKKTGSSKSIKFNTGLDMSVIFNILKMEDPVKITPESQLHLKRQINLKILKRLDLPFKTVQLLEKGIYNYVIDKCNTSAIIPIWDNSEFIDIYVSKSKSLYSNLNTKCYVGNKGLLEKIKKKTVNVYEVAFWDAYKLYPEKWNDIIEEKTKMEKILKDSLKESATDLFQCPRCHKRKTIYCEVQTRSSDEPMTKFITCLECGCKWKKY